MYLLVFTSPSGHAFSIHIPFKKAFLIAAEVLRGGRLVRDFEPGAQRRDHGGGDGRGPRLFSVCSVVVTFFATLSLLNLFLVSPIALIYLTCRACRRIKARKPLPSLCPASSSSSSSLPSDAWRKVTVEFDGFGMRNPHGSCLRQTAHSGHL